jgi:hypothetical protein
MDDETTFGDYEPEDAWDIGDPPRLLVENLRRRLALVRLDRLSIRDRRRMELILGDLAVIRRILEERGD